MFNCQKENLGYKKKIFHFNDRLISIVSTLDNFNVFEVTITLRQHYDKHSEG